MGGYARYVPSSEGNNVVHLDGAADSAAGQGDGGNDVSDGGGLPPHHIMRRRGGVFISWGAAAVTLGAFIVCVLLLIGLVAYFAAAARSTVSAADWAAGNDSSAAAAASAAAGIRPKWPVPAEARDLRLLDSVRPEHYQLTLAPYIYSDNSTAFYFTGSVNITVRVVNETDTIRLHADRIELTNATVRVVCTTTGAVWSLVGLEYSPASQWYVLTLARPIQVGRRYRIEVSSFRKPLLRDLRGLYLSEYTEARKTRYLAVSQLQPTDARRAFPCFDEPAFKARFDVSLVHRSDFIAISNMPTRSVTPLRDPARWFPDGVDSRQTWVEEHYETSPVMSTYLLAFLVSQFHSIQGTDSRGRMYRNWARPDLIGIAGYAMTAVTNITEFFEAYFDVPFPLNKTDQAAVPDFIAGGMENWGLITYREARLLFDQAKDTTASLQNIGNVISHEVAHMWFGNLVTPQWWDDIWLNEGFATFTQILGVQQLHPDWDIDAQFVIESQMSAFQADSKGSSRPIYTDVQNPSQISEIFDAITYRKGAAVLRMVYYFLGDGVFRKAIGAYLRHNSYASTFHTSLYESLTREARASGRDRMDVAEIMDRWIKQMGYPVLTCSRVGHSGVRLTQSHFLSDPSQKPDARFVSQFNYTWIVPITMATQANVTNAAHLTDLSDLVQWLRVESQVFDAGPASAGWYMLNLRSAGFYRVNYDRENWHALIAQLEVDHTVFAPQERARLLDDSFSLAAAGRIDYGVPLNMTRYLRKETHYVPWRAALTKLALLHSMLHRSSAVYGPFSAHMRNLLGPAYSDLSIREAPGDPHMRRLRRALIVSFACQFGVPACRRSARDLFDRLAKTDYAGDLPSPDVRRAVLCEGIAAASSDTPWDILYRRGKADPHPGVQSDITRALACTPESWLLNRYLSYALDERKIRLQDAAAVFSGVSANANGLQIVWDYVRDNWSTIIERIPNSFATSFFIALLGEFNTPQRLAEMLEFKARYRDKLGSAERAMDQALENVRINIRWMDSNLEVVKRWLVENSG